jgi:hypothetical protein
MTSANPPAKAPRQTQNQPPPDFEKQRQDAEQQARPGVEQERKQAEEEAGKTLDQGAVAAIEETQTAIHDIASNKPDSARRDIEQATGKVNILLAGNPTTASIPVSVQVYHNADSPPG